MDLKQSEVTEAKSSIEEPPELELKDLPSHLEYAFLEENDKLPVIIAKGLKNDETDALLKSGIEVDRAKVDVIAKLPHPTTVKGVRSFLGHAGLYLMLFRLLKKSLPIALILVCPIGILPFDIICDASDVAIGDGFRTTKIEALVASITMLSKDNDRAQIIHYHEKGRCLPLSFTITKIFPYGTIELSQPDGPNFKVNGHRVKHYFRGGTLPPKCKRSTKGSDTWNATLAIRVLIKYQSNGHKMDPMIGKDSRDEINSKGACKESLDHSSQAYK
ncbi:hypothetical protein Tco_0514010 [Tanacetum coccineum]